MYWLLWIVAVAVSAGAGYLVYRKDVQREVPFPWLTASLRALLFLLVFLLLLLPPFQTTSHITRKPVIFFLQDKSASVGAALGELKEEYINSAQELIRKLEQHYHVEVRGFDAALTADSIFEFNGQVTDMGSALSYVGEISGVQRPGAVILASDGRFNRGVNPLYALTGIDMPVFAAAIGDTGRQKDLRVSRLYANKTAKLGSRFEIRADLIAELCNGCTGDVQLLRNDQVIASEKLLVSSDQYDRTVSFTLSAEKEGIQRYSVQVSQMPGEENVINNRRDVFVEVISGEQKIWIAAGSPHPDIAALQAALGQVSHYKVTVDVSGRIPADPEEYALLILHGLPVTPAQAAQLRESSRPLWIIISQGSVPQALAQVYDAPEWRMNPAMPQEQKAYLNNSFSGFMLPERALQVADRLPPLAMPMGTWTLPPDAEALWTAGAPSGQPLWWMQAGRRPVSVLAGTGVWRWRMHEYRHFKQHQVVDELIRQCVQYLTAETSGKPLQVSMSKYIWGDQEPVTMGAVLLNASNEPVNTPPLRMVLKDNGGRETAYDFERSGTSYRLNTGILPPGTYTYRAETEYGGETHVASGEFAVEHMPLEFLETGADYQQMYGIAEKYHGGFVTSAQIGSLYDSIRARELVPVIETQHRRLELIDRRWLFFLILIPAVAEWLLRKYWMAQ